MIPKSEAGGRAAQSPTRLHYDNPLRHYSLPAFRPSSASFSCYLPRNPSTQRTSRLHLVLFILCLSVVSSQLNLSLSLSFPDPFLLVIVVMIGLWALSLLSLLASASPVVIDTIHNDAAPILSSVNSKEIPNSYMVVFKKHVDHGAAQRHHSWVQDVHLTTQTAKRELRKRDGSWLQDTVFEGLRHTYHIPGAFLGYSGHFDDDVIEQVRRHPDVRVHCLG